MLSKEPFLHSDVSVWGSRGVQEVGFGVPNNTSLEILQNLFLLPASFQHLRTHQDEGHSSWFHETSPSRTQQLRGSRNLIVAKQADFFIFNLS